MLSVVRCTGVLQRWAADSALESDVRLEGRWSKGVCGGARLRLT